MDGHNYAQSAETDSSGTADVDSFIYLLSHDVRSSVRALLEIPQWIEEDLIAEGQPISETLAENLSILNTHTHRLDQMLVDLLTYSRIGRMQDVTRVDVDQCLEQALDKVQFPDGFTVRARTSGESLTIGERDVVTLLEVLLSNTVKHHNADVGNVMIEAGRDQADFVFRVFDDGPGIPEKYRARVFEPMRTLKPRDEVEGSGMGLAIAQKIAEHYHGHLKWLPALGDTGIGIEARLTA